MKILRSIFQLFVAMNMALLLAACAHKTQPSAVSDPIELHAAKGCAFVCRYQGVETLELQRMMKLGITRYGELMDAQSGRVMLIQFPVEPDNVCQICADGRILFFRNNKDRMTIGSLDVFQVPETVGDKVPITQSDFDHLVRTAPDGHVEPVKFKLIWGEDNATLRHVD